MAAQSHSSGKEGSSGSSINGLNGAAVASSNSSGGATTPQTTVPAANSGATSTTTTTSGKGSSSSSAAVADSGSGDEPRNGPYIDKAASKNVTALLGKTAYLNCRVKNLGNKTVSACHLYSRRIHFTPPHPLTQGLFGKYSPLVFILRFMGLGRRLQFISQSQCANNRGRV